MTRSSKTLLAALLAGTALATAAGAQFGGGGPMVPPGGGTGMPMPMGGGPNMPSGTPLGMGRMPFANGSVTAVDAATGTITLAPMFGGGTPQTVRVTDATQITAVREGTVRDLKVGDTVQVRGVPTGITASQITAGDGADSARGGMGLLLTGPRFGGRLGGTRSGLGGPQAAFAQAAGKITGLTPLTVSVSDGVQVTLRVAPDAKISRNVMEKVGDLKVGDRVMASGKPGEDGVLAANRIRVNSDFGMSLGMSPL
jgi:hypothetical protein